ncbi:MAG: isoaspartyl peptidase/L-asparaginase [Chromatiales bacterium]|nr:isoaspartyl peptidase/L-asparaginase [Chromatiales bacterium]
MTGCGWAIAVHGGAGQWRDADPDAVLDGIRTALEAGRNVLAGGGCADDAVVAAVVVLEDDPLFNAGTGSVLNRAGEVEMDAALMLGDGMQAGAVAAIQRVRNPILVARDVMRHTDHVLLAGPGAQRFAREHGHADHDPITQARRAAAAQSDGGGRTAGNTVGAVALDHTGRLAAATSTGGVHDKLPGRIGDSPIPGAGTYADRRAAVSATGRGEYMIRLASARRVADRIAVGSGAQAAVDLAVRDLLSAGCTEIGLIAVNADAEIGIAHNTPQMPLGYVTQRQPQAIVMMRRTEPG